MTSKMTSNDEKLNSIDSKKHFLGYKILFWKLYLLMTCRVLPPPIWMELRGRTKLPFHFWLLFDSVKSFSRLTGLSFGLNKTRVSIYPGQGILIHPFSSRQFSVHFDAFHWKSIKFMSLRPLNLIKLRTLRISRQIFCWYFILPKRDILVPNRL